MNKLAIIAAIMLMALTACKKEITADFDVKLGYYTFGGRYDPFEDQRSVIVIDKSTNADTYLWEWGDGGSNLGINKHSNKKYNSHSYDKADIYTISLTVANSEGETAYASKTITIL
jgi:hypothetical protein